MSRKLATYVHIDGEVYGPDDKVPADVAKRITNPKAWADGKGSAGDDADPPEGYAALDAKGLKAEIDKRNDGRDADAKISKAGGKDTLIAALEADDKAAAAADDDA